MGNEVLFTCVGTTDTVRGCRDGGMMHIMRHYRPQGVYIFVSREMEALDQKDQRYSKTLQFMRGHWDGYAPKVDYCMSGIEDADDLDVVADPMIAYFEKLIRENPDAPILINLSSGTPQMKVVLSQLALSTRSHAITGVQVRNPDRKSGDSDRTNKKNYSIDEELELNEDEEPGAWNRCLEPKLFAIQRDRVHAQMRSLLERRDYRALEAIGDQLPPDVLPLIHHLAERNDLQAEEAYKLSRTLSLPFPLYPAKKSNAEYRAISEYYLLLRNLCLTKRYSEFVLRMNPFLTHLLVHLLETALPSSGRVIEHWRNGKIVLNVDNLRSLMPAETAALEGACGKTLETSEVSLFVGIPLLRILNCLPEHMMRVLEACLHLNTEQRNPTAHQLHAVTDEDIRRACVDGNGKTYGAADLARLYGDMLEKAYPDVCDRTLFTVYDRCGEYLLQRL